MTIGVLDSGLGGLTTLKELIRANVADRYIYYADNLNAPYGERQAEAIKACVRAGCKAMLRQDAEAIVLACNTATSSVIAELRKEMPVPVFGLEPAIRPALAAGDGKVLVLATQATLKGEKWHRLAENLGDRYEVRALPRLASLIDTFFPDTREIEEYIVKELSSCKGFDRVVLGCTHYVLVKDLIKSAVGEADVFDGNVGLSRLLANLFCSHARSIDIELMFSGEKQYARYAEILGALVKNTI